MPRYSRQCHYIAAYLRRHLPFIRNWDGQATLAWVRWFIEHGRAIAIMDGRKLVGVALVRLVDNPEQANEHYSDTGGKLAYIEVTVCRDGMMPYLFTHFRRTFPLADRMAWVRSKHHNRPVSTDMKKAERLFKY